ncbi:MAG: sugar ABC transporter permease [Bacilli bacterium]|nr:sugar ABC transporter permease [Bacilli bacterium]
MSTQQSGLYLDKGPMQTKKSVSIPIWVKAIIALLPALVFLTFFTIYPIFNTMIISFIQDFAWQDGMGSFAIANYLRQFDMATNVAKWTEYFNEVDPGFTFIPPLKPIFTLNNYLYVLKDVDFLQALANTAILTVISVPLTIFISLLLAVSLNSIKPLRATYQTIFFLPYVTNAIALGMVFNTLFSPQTGGIMNQLVVAFGGQPVSWIHAGFDQEGTLKLSKLSLGFAITVQTVWTGLAFKILVFMSGLASIDKQYYDAARIDGATRGTIFRRITVPLLSPQILYITITSFIGAFKAYQSIIAIVGVDHQNFGGTDGRMWLTVVGYVYRFRNDKLPVAAAGSVVLLIIILLITLVQMQVSKKRVHY